MSSNSRADYPSSPDVRSVRRRNLDPTVPSFPVCDDTVAEAYDLFLRVLKTVKRFEKVITVCDWEFKPVSLVEEMYQCAFTPSCLLWQFNIFADSSTISTGPTPAGKPAASDEALAQFNRGLVKLSHFDLSLAQGRKEASEVVNRFASFVFEHLILTLLADRSAPLPTVAGRIPTTGSEIAHGRSGPLETLRGNCLNRDGYRCVLTGAFHTPELDRRAKSTRNRPLDDDGKPIKWALNDYLDVAHVLPRSLMEADCPHNSNPSGDNAIVSHSDPRLSDRKRITLALLQVFCPSILSLIDGPRIDNPANALSLCMGAHERFGRFDTYFTPADDCGPDTYRVRAFKQSDSLWLKTLGKDRVTKSGPQAGVKVTFRSGREHPVPSFQLLQVHSVIAKLIHKSAARYLLDDIA